MTIRCIHRHTIDEHPNCFMKGLINYIFENEKEFIKLTGLPWYNFPGYKIGYLDIETQHSFGADYGVLLSWCIKEKDGDIKSSIITKRELFEEEFDKRLVKECLDELKNYKIIVGYYSEGFDIPFLRTKALHYDFDFPGYGELYHWDLYYTAKYKLKLSKYSLANVCDYLNISGKTPLDRETWNRAGYGDKRALERVLEHNKADVIITEKLHNKISFTRKWIR